MTALGENNGLVTREEGWSPGAKGAFVAGKPISAARSTGLFSAVVAGGVLIDGPRSLAGARPWEPQQDSRAKGLGVQWRAVRGVFHCPSHDPSPPPLQKGLLSAKAPTPPFAYGWTVSKGMCWHFPGSPMVRVLGFPCRGHGFHPWWGN